MEDKENRDNFKIISDGEIELRLTLSIEKSRQFYYLIYNVGSDKIIGKCGIRINRNEENYYLGNIEYDIEPTSRGNHYAEKSARLLATIASYYNVNNIILTARPENIPSIKTIQNLGANFIEVKKVPKSMKLFRSNNRFVSIYEWDLSKKGERKL